MTRGGGDFPLVLCAAAIAAVLCARAEGSGKSTLSDPSNDAVARRTDPGADGALNPWTQLPDVRSIVVGGWACTNPQSNPYQGSWVEYSPSLMRLDVVFQGFVNPPGPLGLGFSPFDPFEFGSSPVYGFIDIDMDEDRDTGGECWGAESTRYLANIGRFGEVPKGSRAGRMAKSGAQDDGNFSTSPQIERSGAEFSLVLCGCFDPTVQEVCGDGDWSFEPGETWIVRGRFFQRAGGFVEASAAYGGSQPGLYDPEVDLRFTHDIATNRTTVTLVFPLTMAGAGLLAGEAPEAIDLCVSNQASVEEAMSDVIDGIWSGLSYPSWVMAHEWGGRSPEAALDPEHWRVDGLVGTSYADKEPWGALYVWTDAVGDHRLADFDSSGAIGAPDRAQFDSAVAAQDGTVQDGDGSVNGTVLVTFFGSSFSVYDLDYDGMIGGQDRLLIPLVVPGDANADCAVNFADVTSVLSNYGAGYSGVPQGPGDADGDGAVSFADITTVLSNWGSGC